MPSTATLMPQRATLVQDEGRALPGGGVMAAIQRRAGRDGRSSPTKCTHSTAPSATFGTAARALLERAASPRPHAYATPAETLRGLGSTAFARAPREPPSDRAHAGLTPVHSYAALKLLVPRPSSAKFTQAKRPQSAGCISICPVHTYAHALGTLTSNTGRFGRAPKQPAAAKDTNPTHAYGRLPSSLNGAGKPCTFGKYEGSPLPSGVVARPAASCGVHSYAQPVSSLRSQGVAGWGPPPASKQRRANLRAVATR